ncbi:ShlB/FhaC/HecB family hemolysin secretion/activation protein [Dyella amyloliquefaciens]|uniref:ShlB/FhaC/HecB family hemolysin secretion/activation protein n=1 Tax=Dyella amyloliquefaciens TaxID=1770545 RepID=UPI0013EE7A10|nr:ShlB/FhaC/HecB family hemolysin secretion/activation protein [Dyella amyloliquefaciens]
MQGYRGTAPWRRVVMSAALAAGCSSGILGVAQAQTQSQVTPSTLQNDAQRQQRYYQQQQTPPPVQQTDPLQQPAAPAVGAANAHTTARFVLKRVEFTPSALLKPADLAAAVKPYEGREVDGAKLAQMLDAVNNLYRARKITTARALFKNQPVVDGVVHVDLIEGRLGKVAIKGKRHVSDHYLAKRLDLKEGEVVDAEQLRDKLVTLNRTTDLQAQAVLVPGASRGLTDVQLDVQEPSRWALDAFVDNGGVDSTGRNRVGLQGHLYSLFGIDDMLDGNVAHSSGGNDGSVSYSVPLFPNNGRLGVSYSHSQINVINQAFRNIDIQGTSSVTSLNYNQPLIATLDWLFSGIGSYSITDSNTHISGQDIADTRTNAWTLGASLAHQSDGQRWGATQLFTRIRSDEPLLGKSDFTIAPGSAYFIQRLWQSRWALRADLGWQFSATGNLPSANLFQIGGPGSVRGYERGVLSGARGYYADLELHRSVGERLDLFGFVDHGQVSSSFPGNQQISGAGVGGSYSYRWITASADVAKPFVTVIPDQDSVRFDFRLTAHFD